MTTIEDIKLKDIEKRRLPAKYYVSIKYTHQLIVIR